MSQCPHCTNPYDKGQRYCSVCGSFLLHPEEGDKFCPQCDVRVSPKQEFCHECDAPLTGPAAQGAAGAKAPEPPPAPGAYPLAAPAKGMQPLIVWGLVAAGVIIMILLLVLLFSRTSPPPAPTPAVSPKTEAPPAPAPPAPAPPAPAPAAPKEEAPTPAAPATPPAAPPETKAPPALTPPAGLREELLSVLSGMREGHLKKDIVLYMSAYSLTFPGLDEKRRTTLAAWNNYDYINLVFTLDDMQLLDTDNVVAHATWYIDTRDRRTRELASAKQTYEVRFVKEMGKWRIRSLEEASKGEME